MPTGNPVIFGIPANYHGINYCYEQHVKYDLTYAVESKSTF